MGIVLGVLSRTMLLVAVLVVPFFAFAEDQSAALKRLDAIIAEMQKLRAEFVTLSSSLPPASQAPAVLGASTKKYLTQDLSFGATNSDIERIQRLFAADKEIYPYQVISGFFGPKTEDAVKNFQTRFGLDPVGVFGPATIALLESFFNAYPDENYPAGVLAKKPQVAGVSTSAPTSTTAPVTPATTGANPAKSIKVTLEDGEALIEIVYTNGNRKGLIAGTDDEDEVVTFISTKTVLTKSQIEAVIDFDENGSTDEDEDDDDDDEDYDEDDADEALDAAEDAIADASDAIEEADDDGEETGEAENLLEQAEDALSDAEDAYDDEDYDEAVELAEEAEDLADDAKDAIGEDEDDDGNGEIDSITAEVEEGEAQITVEYEDGDEEEFDVEEDKEDNIIEEVADELNLDEDEVEDLIEFEYGGIDDIEAVIEDNRAIVYVNYDSGFTRRFIINETDEDEIVSELADLIDEDEDDIEDLIEFD